MPTIDTKIRFEGFSGDPTPYVPEKGWAVFAANREVATQSTPNGFSVQIGEWVIIKTDSAAGTVVAERQVVVFYPETWEDDWLQGDATATAVLDMGIFLAGPITGVSTTVYAPFVAAISSGTSGGTFIRAGWPQPTSTEGRIVTCAKGVYGLCRSTRPERLIIDWGDGTRDERALVSSQITGNGDSSDGYYQGELLSPISHEYMLDEKNEGSGRAASCWVVDEWGRKSQREFLYLFARPVLEVSFDDETGDFLLDTSKSYGLTGKVHKRLLSFGVPLGIPGFRTGLLEAEPTNPALFRVPPTLYGEYDFSLALVDGHMVPGYKPDYNGPIVETKPDNGLATIPGKYYQNSFQPQSPTRHYEVHRPPQSAVVLPTGDLLQLTEGNLWQNPVVFFYHRKRIFGIKGTPANAYKPFGFGLGKTRDTMKDASQGRLVQGDGQILLTVRKSNEEQRGQIWLYSSPDEGQSWEEKAMVWSGEYFHEFPVALEGGGMASVALKRVDTGKPDPVISGQNTYWLELWFKRTGDIENWDSEPVMVFRDTYEYQLYQTLLQYPTLVNLSAAGQGPTLVVYVFQKAFESSGGGTMGTNSQTTGAWREVGLFAGSV